MCPQNHLSGLSGNFTSPNFPDHYPFKLQCIYNITAPQGYRIEIEFSVLDLEYHVNCTADYLLVETVAGWFQYCGRFTPPMPYMVSKGANMVVVFVSNEKNVYQGFKGHYKAVPLAVTSTASPIQPTKTMSVMPSSTVVTPPPEMPDYLVGSFVLMKNNSMKGHTIKKLVTSSNIACVMLCQRNARCKSVTYMTLHKSSGHCILHDTVGTPDSLEQRDDAVFYRIVA
ncbi:Membrane frizzled-related protein [Exaiptasia diaphana]|nr:Membrane frizzled-related protein [Exaiptasia diaphana]